MIKKVKANWKRILIFVAVPTLLVLNVYKLNFGFDVIVLTLFFASIFHTNPLNFLRDWMPPIFAFYLYEYLRGYAEDYAFKFNREVIIQPIITIEEKLFFFMDRIPTVYLQQELRPDYSQTNWYDYVLFFFYASFFWFWLVVGYIIWYYQRQYFKKYMWGLVGFSMFGVIIFFLFPSAPPWYAADNGYLPYLSRILWTSDYLPSDSLTFVNTYGRNDVAAIPSFHVAWPLYAALFMIKIFGKKFIPLLIFPSLIAFADRKSVV